MRGNSSHSSYECVRKVLGVSGYQENVTNEARETDDRVEYVKEVTDGQG